MSKNQSQHVHPIETAKAEAYCVNRAGEKVWEKSLAIDIARGTVEAHWPPVRYQKPGYSWEVVVQFADGCIISFPQGRDPKEDLKRV